MVFMSISQQVCTMAGTHVAGTLAIRADFGALLVRSVVMRVFVFLFRGFWRLSKTIHSDDGEADRKYQDADSCRHPIFHRGTPFLESFQDTVPRHCELASLTVGITDAASNTDIALPI
jgi:hypothetical protein